ncbi:MAG: hypothetical protein ACM3ST_15740 [Bdellovibrio bacteriovorus]
MTDRSPVKTISEEDPGPAGLWPSPEYADQVERLRAAVGETIYLTEIEATEVQLGVRLTDKPYVLLGVLDFPRPDPSRGLGPHLILLDDGRVNLGRIARISRDRPFGPGPFQVLLQDRRSVQALLTRERRLSKELVAQRSRQILGEILGERTTQARLAVPRSGSDDGPPNTV